jgi:hypothetical protein
MSFPVKIRMWLAFLITDDDLLLDLLTVFSWWLEA